MQQLFNTNHGPPVDTKCTEHIVLGMKCSHKNSGLLEGRILMVRTKWNKMEIPYGRQPRTEAVALVTVR